MRVWDDSTGSGTEGRDNFGEGEICRIGSHPNYRSGTEARRRRFYFPLPPVLEEGWTVCPCCPQVFCDTNEGEFFICRVAGNYASTSVAGSVQYLRGRIVRFFRTGGLYDYVVVSMGYNYVRGYIIRRDI